MKALLVPVCAAALAARAPEEVAPVWAPEAGTTLRRTFDSEAHYSLEDFQLTVDGESPPHPIEGDDQEIDSFERIVLVDELEELGDGRPASLRRTYEEITERTVYRSGDEEAEQNVVCDLEGEVVRFLWDEDDEEWTLEAEDEELDGELLEQLVEDADFRQLLPGYEVEEGDSWELDGALYLALMWPGGLMPRYDEEAGEVDPEEWELGLLLIEDLDGEGEATLEEVREEDDRRLAVIAFELEISAGGEIEIETDEQVEDASRGVTIARTLEGEALWDLDAGHLVSLTAETEAELELTFAFTAEGPQGSVDVVRTMTYAGGIDYEVEFAAE